MRIAVMTSPGIIEIRDVEMPVLREGEVLIRIRNIGICGSDIHISHGHLPFVQYPLVQGHEASGDVVDTKGCVRIQEGDRVVIKPSIICGECDACKSGRNNFCENLRIIGVHVDGVSAEYVTAPECSVIKIPDEIPYEIAAMIEPLAVAVHAVNMAGNVIGKTVMVAGAGIIGNLVAQVAKAKGAKVMITGRTQYRLDYAKQADIDYCINETTDDLEEAVAVAFGSGADITFECTGADVSVNQAFYFCKKGGTVVIAGVFGEKQTIDMFLLQDKELNVVGTMLYLESDYEESIKLILENKIDLEPLITAIFPLEDFSEAYRFIADKKNPVMKVMLSTE